MIGFHELSWLELLAQGYGRFLLLLRDFLCAECLELVWAQHFATVHAPSEYILLASVRIQC